MLDYLSSAGHMTFNWLKTFMYKFVLSILLTVLSTTCILAAPQKRFHTETTPCERCHLLGMNIMPELAYLLIGPQEILCGSCHAKANLLNHPSGFSPKGKLPENYPPDWKGDMTCSTCHDVHGNTLKLIRGNIRGKAFCLACHDANFFTQIKNNKTPVTTLAHSVVNIGASVTSLDNYSSQCMRCHNNKTNTLHLTQNITVNNNSGHRNHPISTQYESVAHMEGYRPINQLSKNIFLPNGQLSCLSCHKGYSKRHGSLVTTTTGSALCLECHDL